MKDQLLLKLMRSRKFQRMSKQEQMIEIADYKHQSRNFNNKPQEES